MKEKEFFSTTELAKILGISRVAVFKRIKRGEIKATKVGRNFVINKKDIGNVFGQVLTQKEKKEIEAAIKKTIQDYGKTLELLGQK